MTNITCHVSLEINASKTKIWKALIDPEQIKKYLFGTNTRCDWKVGSPIRFTGEWEGKPYEDKGTILQIEKEKILKYDYWSSMSGQPDLPENYLVVTYQLSEKDGRTLFTLTQENCKTIEARDHSESNWKMVLDGLRSLVESD